MLAAVIIAGGGLRLLSCTVVPGKKSRTGRHTAGASSNSDAEVEAIAQATVIATVAVVASATANV
jgi:hypothetical protein